VPQSSDTDLKRKARWVEDKLTEFYGPRPYNSEAYDQDLVGALVATILSQHTSDLNSGRAFLALKSAYPGGWDAVRAASATDIADVIRSGGLADMKAPRIKALLNEINARNGVTSIDEIRSMSDTAGMAYLTSFHGVGPKTAACILMFNLGRPVIAVDTHVHRVSLRLGLVPLRTSAEKTQDALLTLMGPKRAYSCHVHLIEHGRTICHAQRPNCGICPVSKNCNFFNERQYTDAPKAKR
jgi:endonuclease-3